MDNINTNTQDRMTRRGIAGALFSAFAVGATAQTEAKGMEGTGGNEQAFLRALDVSSDPIEQTNGVYIPFGTYPVLFVGIKANITDENFIAWGFASIVYQGMNQSPSMVWSLAETRNPAYNLSGYNIYTDNGNGFQLVLNTSQNMNGWTYIKRLAQ